MNPTTTQSPPGLEPIRDPRSVPQLAAHVDDLVNSVRELVQEHLVPAHLRQLPVLERFLDEQDLRPLVLELVYTAGFLLQARPNSRLAWWDAARDPDRPGDTLASRLECDELVDTEDLTLELVSALLEPGLPDLEAFQEWLLRRVYSTPARARVRELLRGGDASEQPVRLAADPRSEKRLRELAGELLAPRKAKPFSELQGRSLRHWLRNDRTPPTGMTRDHHRAHLHAAVLHMVAWIRLRWLERDDELKSLAERSAADQVASLKEQRLYRRLCGCSPAIVKALDAMVEDGPEDLAEFLTSLPISVGSSR